MNVPKLRFKEFTGEWEEKRLSNYLYVNTARNKNNIFNKNDVLSVSGEFGIVNQILFQGRSFAGESVELYHVVETGDIVYTKSPLKANPYGIIKYNSGDAGIVSTLYAVYHCKPNCSGKFVEYYFDNDLRLNKYLKPLVNIGAKHDMKISDENALSGNVILPSYDEQCKIDSFLKIIDERIEKQKDIIDTLSKQKKALMQKIFSQELRFKDENGKEFPDWEEKKLGEIFEIKAGGDIDKNHVSKTKEGNFIYPIYANALINEGIYGYSDIYKIDNDSITVTGRGDIGVAKARCGKFYPIVRLLVLIPKETEDMVFFENLINYTKKYDESTGVPQLTVPQLSKIKVKVPSFEEQFKIGELFRSLDAKMEKGKMILKHWQQIKKGLLKQMFV